MDRRKVVAVLAGVLAAVGLLCLYGWLGPKRVPELTIGYQSNIIYLPVFVAEERGYFSDEGLHVDLIQFPSANEMMQALKTGAIDITGMSSLSVVARNQAETPGSLRLLALEKFTPTDSPDAIVVHKSKPIARLDDFRQHTLGTWKGSTIRTYVSLFFRSENIPLEDVTIIDMGEKELVDLFRLGKIDGAFTFEPWVTELVLEGGGRILERGPLAKRLLGTPQVIFPGGSAVRSGFCKEHGAEILAYRRAYAKAIGDIDRDYAGALPVLKRYSTTKDEVLQNMGRMQWVLSSPEHIGDVQKLLNLYAREGITESVVSAATLMFCEE